MAFGSTKGSAMTKTMENSTNLTSQTSQTNQTMAGIWEPDMEASIMQAMTLETAVNLKTTKDALAMPEFTWRVSGTGLAGDIDLSPGRSKTASPRALQQMLSRLSSRGASSSPRSLTSPRSLGSPTSLGSPRIMVSPVKSGDLKSPDSQNTASSSRPVSVQSRSVSKSSAYPGQLPSNSRINFPRPVSLKSDVRPERRVDVRRNMTPARDMRKRTDPTPFPRVVQERCSSRRSERRARDSQNSNSRTNVSKARSRPTSIGQPPSRDLETHSGSRQGSKASTIIPKMERSKSTPSGVQRSETEAQSKHPPSRIPQPRLPQTFPSRLALDRNYTWTAPRARASHEADVAAGPRSHASMLESQSLNLPHAFTPLPQFPQFPFEEGINSETNKTCLLDERPSLSLEKGLLEVAADSCDSPESTLSSPHGILNVRKSLSVAMEEHDLPALRKLVPRASELGLEVGELNYAQRMLEFCENREDADPATSAKIKRALNEAVEEHDVNALRALLRRAWQAGIPQDELMHAVRILEYCEYHQSPEVDEVGDNSKFKFDFSTCRGHEPVCGDPHRRGSCSSELFGDLRAMYPDASEDLLERASHAGNLNDAMDIILVNM